MKIYLLYFCFYEENVQDESCIILSRTFIESGKNYIQDHFKVKVMDSYFYR